MTRHIMSISTEDILDDEGGQLQQDEQKEVLETVESVEVDNASAMAEADASVFELPIPECSETQRLGRWRVRDREGDKDRYGAEEKRRRSRARAREGGVVRGE